MAKGDELFFVIQELEGRGASQREGLKAIRAQGRKIGDKKFRQLYNTARDIKVRARKLRSSRKNFKPSIDSIPKVPTVSPLIRGRFAYHVELTGKNVAGDKVAKGQNIITIVSDKVQDRATVEKQARDLMTQADAGPISGSDQMQLKGLKVRLVGILQRETFAA